METKLAEALRGAAVAARGCAAAFPASIGRDDLPWRVIEAFDAQVRGQVERDPRIEDERDRVLVSAVTLAELRSDDADEIAAARGRLIEAIDFLEQAVLRFGLVNRRAARKGLGEAGQPVARRS